MIAIFFTIMALLSGFVYFFGLISLLVKERIGISESLVGTLFGMAISFIKKCGVIDKMYVLIQGVSKASENVDLSYAINQNNEITSVDTFMKELSRIVVSLQVMAVGIAVPKTYIKNEKISLFMVLVPLMILTYITSCLFAMFILRVDPRIAMVIGACVTPTDPVLAATIMKGKFASKYIPVHLRNLLTVESGANDGLGSLLLALPLFFIQKNKTRFVLKTIFVDIFLSIIFGAALGYFCRKLQIYCKEKNWIDKESFLVSTISLGIFVTSLAALVHSTDILASFVCGMFFSWDQSLIVDIKESHLLEVIDLLINHVFFILFGYLIDWKSFQWKFLIYIFVVLFVRRLPFFIALRIIVPQLKTVKEAVFAGYFGPVGVGAILFAYHGYEQIGNVELDGKNEFLPLIQFVILGSIVVHGIAGLVLTRIIGKDKGYDPDESEYATESNCLVEEDTNNNFY